MSGYEEDAHAHHGHPGAPLAFLVLALFAGIFARTLLPKKLPYTVWLLGLGVVAGVVWDHEDAKTAHLGKVERMVLIFESAFNTDFHTLFNELGQILVLAVPGVVLGTAATACCARAIYLDGAGAPRLPWPACALLGSILSATDPVAVVALMSELGVSKRLATLLEGESLLNDGTAIVIFSVFYRRCAREGVSSLGFAVVAPYALRMALCGPLLGAAVGQAASVFLGFVYEDPVADGAGKRVIQRRFNVAEIALTLAAAYGTFCLCEMVTVDGASFTSGVLALVALGVTLGERGREHGTAAAAHRLHAFWELAGFVANTSIFFVAGAMIASRVSLGRLGELCALYVALMAVRFAMLALLSPLLRRMGYGFGLPQFGALGWGALRGAVGLALALVVEENENIDARVRDDVMSAVAGITCLTLVVNGTSMEFALAKLGLSQPSVEEERRFRATCRELGERSDATLRDVVERDRYLGGADAAVVCQYLPVHDAATARTRRRRRRDAPSAREVWGEERRVAAVLKAELWHLHHAGFVSADSLELLAEVCDVAVDRIFRLEKGPAGGAARGGAGDAEAAVAERASLWDGVLRPRLEAYAIDLDFPERARRATRRPAARTRPGRLRDDVGKAEAWIGAYASAFPEMARTVKTEAAVRVLLRREAANAEKLQRPHRLRRAGGARKLAISERKCGLQYSGLVSFFDFLFTGHSEAFADLTG
ncbi:potassium:proton antiporter [Aureococcus anophagefferens]|nr:potassium:proton antiporter [Aureococcus anophagefferens]